MEHLRYFWNKISYLEVKKIAQFGHTNWQVKNKVTLYRYLSESNLLGSLN